MKEALGLIETVGMAAAIEAADTCVKSANVELIGYELTRGQGMVTVKIKGDVGAVKAGIEAAKISAAKVSKVVSTLVIPRPAQGIEGIIESDSTVGIIKEKDNEEETIKNEEETIKSEEKVVVKQKEMVDVEKKTEEKESEEKEEISETKVEADVKEEELKEDIDTCNICHDTACLRRKGQPKNMCIHYNEMQGDINGRV
jgi:ethanolamine utilization protein EutM